MVESLEQRTVPAELSGWLMSVTPTTASRGQNVDVAFNVTNSGFDTVFTPFNVAIYLSRDFTLSLDDRLLHSETVPYGFPGFFTSFTQFRTLALPGASDTYWGSDSNFQLLMLVDGFDQVFEFNEWDNISAVSLSVTGSGGGGGGGGGEISRLDDLPETNAPAGSILRQILRDLPVFLKEAAADQKQMLSILGKGASVASAQKELTALSKTITALGKKFKPMLYGSADSVTLPDGSIFNRTHLAVVEKYLKYIFTDQTNILSSNTVMGDQGGRRRFSADEDPLGGLFKIQAWEDTKKWWKDTTAKASKIASDLKNDPIGYVGSLLGKSATEGAKAKATAKAVTEGTDVKNRVDQMQQENQMSREEFLRNLDLLDSTPPAEKLMKVAEKIYEAIQDVDSQIVDLESHARNRALEGRWTGTVHKDGLQGTIIFKFKFDGARLSGSSKNDFLQNGKRVGHTNGSFEGQVDNVGVFRGTIRVSNKSGEFTGQAAWTLQNGILSGNLVEDGGFGVTFSAHRYGQ